MASENVSFDAEGYQMTPDDKMRERLEAEIVGDTTIEVEAETQETEKEQPKAEENHEGTNNSKEETIMENQYEQQNAVQPEEGLFSDTIDYVSNNPLTVAAGVAAIAGATLLISKKLSKPSVDTLSLAPASSMASAVAKSGSKAAKYALMMRR